MEHLARVRAGRKDRVVAALAGVAESCALLGVAVHLADKGVDIDDEAPLPGPGAGRPRALEHLRKHAIELADVNRPGFVGGGGY